MKPFPYFPKKLNLLFWIFALVLFSAQSTLSRSIPEREGVSSEAVLSFLKKAEADSTTEFRSFMLIRNGKVISEAYWNPYQSEYRNTLYSCSKSFTATAIGFAVQEGKLNVTDKVISFFPEKLPSEVSENLKNLTIQHLLTMSAGIDPEPSFIRTEETDWVKAYLNTPVVHQPGSRFAYSSLATYMLSAIIQKVSGETLIDYLTPRLFNPLNIHGMDWETDALGINTGGWGLRIKTEDMAKFALLFLQNGKWDGKQLISVDWIKEASSAHILQNPAATPEEISKSDWLQGYGYQMWRSRHNTYRGDGAFGQYMLVLPEQNAVIAITAESKDLQQELNLVWEYLLPAFQSEPLPENKKMHEELQKFERSLSIQPLSGTLYPKINKKYTFSNNPKKYESVQWISEGKELKMILTIEGKEYPFIFASGEWKKGETMMQIPNLTSVLSPVMNTSMLYPAKTANSFVWKTAQQLEMKTIYLETPHSQTMLVKFEKDKLTFEIKDIKDFGNQITVLYAKEQKK